MRLTRHILTILLMVTISPARAALSDTGAPAPETLSIAQLEQKLAEIDTELGQQANYSLRSGAGSIGYRSKSYDTSNNPEWVQVDLEQDFRIDEIVLVPTLLRDTKKSFQAEGFPLEFRIVTGTTRDRQGTAVASFSAEDGLLPRIAPLVVPCPGATASWVRVEANLLSPRGIDGRFALQLSELLAFSGSTNCALRRLVRSAPNLQYPTSAWGNRFLTDGSIPYLMDAATGERSLAFLNSVGVADHPSLTIDLEAIQTVSQVNLHAIDQSDTVPQAFFGDFGVPTHLQIEGAIHPDFSNSVQLLEAHFGSIYDMAPVMAWNLPATPCRFVRLTALEPYIYDDGMHRGSRIAFAEFELFAQGQNISRGKQVTGNFEVHSYERPIDTLTDGRNFYGDILPIREWLQQLARRHDLEKQRPIVAAELSQRYQRQNRNFHRLAWLAALLAGAIVITVLVERVIRQRAIFRTRERIAANIHDELGANLYAIGMLGDLAKDEAGASGRLVEIVDRIRALTSRTGAAARYCTTMLEATDLCENLTKEMKRSAYRLLADAEHDISFTGEENLSQLSPRRRIGLFLFYKECLTNVIRHSNATRIETDLAASRKEVRLTITDNGIGSEDVPASLKRRARLLRGKVSATRPPTGGTCIALTLRPRKWRLGRRGTGYEMRDTG